MSEWWFWAAAAICGWLVADFGYARFVAWRLRRWEVVQHWDTDGVRGGCREYARGTAPRAALLIHGFNDSPRVFDKLAPWLVERGWTVRAMRLPGFGQRLAAMQRIGRHEWLDAVRHELQALRATHAQVLAVGHSLGGALALACLAREPELADTLVLLAPAIRVSRARSPLLRPETWHRLSQPLLLFTRATYSPFLNDTQDPAERQYPWGTKFSLRRSHGEMFALFAENASLARQLRTPVLMVVARHDRVVDSAAAVRFFQDIPADPRRLLEMEQAAHVIPLDFGWEQVGAAMLGFHENAISQAATTTTGPPTDENAGAPPIGRHRDHNSSPRGNLPPDPVAEPHPGS